MTSGSVTGAARLLDRSQPAITRLVQELEAEIGYALFVRSGPRVTPTEQAYLLYGDVERALGGLRHIRVRAADIARGSASQPLVLVASTGSGVKNLAEFTQKVSKNPGKFSYGSSGVGTSLHLAGEMIKEQGKLFMTHIPYRGVAPLTNDLMGNNLEYGVFVLSSGLPHIKSGKVIALGTTEATRSAATPDIPAISESAQYKNVDIGVWFALMAPAHLPKPVFDKLKKALNEALQAPELRKKLESSGSTVSSPSVNIDKFLAAEVAKYKQIVEFAKIEE